MQKTTLHQFRRWRKYYEQKWNRREKWEHYAAHILAAIIRGWAKHPRKIKVKDQFLEFVFKMVGQDDIESMTDEEKIKLKKTRTANSKLYWGMMLGAPQKPPPRPDSVSIQVPKTAAPTPAARAEAVARMQRRRHRT